MHVGRDQIRRRYFGIFDFRFSFGDTANFVSLYITMGSATPNQHLLTLSSSPVGKSSDLHAGVQQFNVFKVVH